MCTPLVNVDSLFFLFLSSDHLVSNDEIREACATACAMHGAIAEGELTNVTSCSLFAFTLTDAFCKPTTGAVFDMVKDKDGLTEVLKSTVIVHAKAPDATTTTKNNNKRSRQTKTNKAAEKNAKLAVRRLFFSRPFKALKLFPSSGWCAWESAAVL